MSSTMIDPKVVGPWIQPKHLEPDSISSYRETFESHPARMILIRDFLVESKAEKLSRFLREEGEFKFEYGVYSKEDPVPEDEWGQAADDDRFFRLGKLVGTPQQFQFSPNALTYLQFRQTFQRPEFKAYFEAISGMDLGASDDFGAHYMRAGDFLRPHNDDNRNRRLALVLYLSPEWDSSFGGELTMIDKHGAAHTTYPEYNSIVAFDTLAETTHHIEPVQPSAEERARVTIGGWYHKPS